MLTFGNTYLNFGGIYLDNVAGVVTSFLNPNVVVKASKLNESTNLHFKVFEKRSGYDFFTYWPTQSEVGNEYTYSPEWKERYQQDTVPSGNLWSGTMTSTPVNECWVYTSPCNSDSTPVKSDLSIVTKNTDTPISAYSAVSWPENTGTSTITLYGLNPEVTATSSTIVSICFDRFNSAAQFKPYQYMVDCTPLAWDNGVYAVERADLSTGAYAYFNDSGCYRISNMTATNTTAMVGVWYEESTDNLRRKAFPTLIENSYISGGPYTDGKQVICCYEARNVSSCANWLKTSSYKYATLYAHNFINCSGVVPFVRKRLPIPEYAKAMGQYGLLSGDNYPGLFNTVGWWKSGNTWTYNDNSAYNPLSSQYPLIEGCELYIDYVQDAEAGQFNSATIKNSELTPVSNNYGGNTFAKCNISNSRFYGTYCVESGSTLLLPRMFVGSTFTATRIGDHLINAGTASTGVTATTYGSVCRLVGSWSVA